MAKIKLGNRPKSFKHAITTQLPDGSQGSIEVSYIYRTRTEFGALLDELRGAETAPAKGRSAPSLKVQTEARDSDVRFIMSIIDGWNLDVELSREAVEQLWDELPGVAAQILGDYSAAIFEGRLGN
jgi:hypothetical protein